MQGRHLNPLPCWDNPRGHSRFGNNKRMLTLCRKVKTHHSHPVQEGRKRGLREEREERERTEDRERSERRKRG